MSAAALIAWGKVGLVFGGALLIAVPLYFGLLTIARSARELALTRRTQAAPGWRGVGAIALLANRRVN